MPTTTKTSILIVEDDAHFQETLSDAMSLKGIEVQGAATGSEAIAALEARRPSLVLLDVQLPDSHGFDLCRRIRATSRFRDLPIILLSARFTEPADRAEGLLAGADAYLSKPVNLETLWEEVHYLLDRNG